MCDPAEPFDFPDLPDETVIAVNDFLEEFYTRFQSHYFAQGHRYDYGRLRRQHPESHYSQMVLPLSDPPFQSTPATGRAISPGSLTVRVNHCS